MPTSQTFKVEQVYANETLVKSAKPGENVLIKLSSAGTEDVQKGYVICGGVPCRAVDKVMVEMAIVDLPESTPIVSAGFKAVFHCICCEEECSIGKIYQVTDGKGNKHGGQFCKVGNKIVARVDFGRTVTVEEFEKAKFLGRFTLRTEGKTVAIGKVVRLPK